MISFVLVILVGSVLLMLPFSSKSREFTGFLDALFTATSATCVTGLIVFDTFTHWSYFGQVVILSLIQVGGLGLVTLTSFISMAIGRKMGLRSMQLAQESVNSSGLETAGNMVRMVVKTSMAFELLGALLLCITFVPQYGLEGVWISVFLSVSAFCNAGFDILGRQTPYISLCNYNGNLMVTGVIMALIIAGGLGFYVWQELFAYFRTKKLSLHTRVVLIVTGILIGAGFLVFAVFGMEQPGHHGRPLLVREIHRRSIPVGDPAHRRIQQCAHRQFPTDHRDFIRPHHAGRRRSRLHRRRYQGHHLGRTDDDHCLGGPGPG